MRIICAWRARWDATIPIDHLIDILGNNSNFDGGRISIGIYEEHKMCFDAQNYSQSYASSKYLFV